LVTHASVKQIALPLRLTYAPYLDSRSAETRQDHVIGMGDYN